MCTATGKRRYPSYSDARRAATEIRNEMDQDHGRPYRCDECGGWHLGRTKEG
jgi:hypothetical protein